mgnify:CR=1 FL=1
MKIIYLVHSISYKGGGVFFHALHLAKRLKNLGHDVTILSISEKKRIGFNSLNLNGIELIESPDLFFGQARTGWDLWDTICRILYLRNKNYDLVHCFDCRPVVIFPGLFLKYFKRSKLIIEWLDWFGKGGTATERKGIIKFFMLPIETFFEEKFRKFADGSIGLGKPLTLRLKEYKNLKNIITIYHGCDIDSLKVIEKFEARNKVNLETNAYYIGYTGRMREDVIVRLVNIIKGLRKKIQDKNIFCLIIGNPAFDFEKYLDDFIKPFFISTGWIEYDKLNFYLSSCDFLTLPFSSRSVARNGIWPSKFNDYLSVGRPILATELTVLKDIFYENEIGFMVRDDDDELIKKSYLLLTNPVLLDKFGKNARYLAETNLAWDYLVSKIDNFYFSIK